MNVKSRTQHRQYNIARIEVPDNKVPWTQPFDYYIENRPTYTHPDVKNNLLLEIDDKKRWAEDFNISDKEKDNLMQRMTYINGYPQTLLEANLIFDDNNLPINPVGRTGMYGAGLLGKNGPNQAADPIFTRWAPFTTEPFVKAVKSLYSHKCTEQPHLVFTSLNKYNPDYIYFPHLVFWEIIKTLILMLPHLEMIAIERRDTREWAIPGGMVEDGQTVSQTLRNEINEEACNNMDPNNASKEIDKIFSKSNGTLIYRGYVDDPRNTDSRWMETHAVHYHCDGKLAEAIKLNAGDDARKVAWLTMSPLESRYRNLYASHKSMTDKAMLRIIVPYYVCNILLFIIALKISNVIFG